MGIIPQTERRRQTKAEKDPQVKAKTKIERITEKIERLKRTGDWHRARLKKLAREMKEKTKKLRKMTGAVDDEVALPDEDAQEISREGDAFVARILTGTENGADPSLTLPHEQLISGSCIETIDDTHVALVSPKALEGVSVIQSRTENRVRYDFSLVLRRIDVSVEKKSFIDANGERRMVSASTTDLGPPRFAVTWEFIAHVVVLVVHYAMPFHRIARMLSTAEKRFTTGSIAKMVHYAASRFLPIHLHHFDALADAEILMGDDTPSRVLEVQSFFASGDPDEKAPWAAWIESQKKDTVGVKANSQSTPDRKPSPIPNQDPTARPLADTCADELGFCFPRRNGDGNKQAFNTTVIAGKSRVDDPKSLIVFYRSHLGSLGNLLEVLLKRRKPIHRDLIVQSDLSTTNRVKDPRLLELFNIQQAGCTSHARRPFARYEHEDPELSGIVLSLFSEIGFLEATLDEWGRNLDNVNLFRSVDAKAIWDSIEEAAELVASQWSKETKLGEGARYILRHKEALQLYLSHPRLGPTNNFSERSLRMEKIIQANSNFRATLEGRCAFDILRSIGQTAIAAEIDLTQYYLSVFKTDQEEIVANPDRYTPYAWAQARAAVEAAQAVEEAT
jgi:hypothetical protein